MDNRLIKNNIQNETEWSKIFKKLMRVQTKEFISSQAELHVSR